MKLTAVVLLLSIASFASSASILGVFPFPSKSNHILGEILLKELAKRGHQVTMISPYGSETPLANYTDIVLDGLKEYMDDKQEQMTKQNFELSTYSKLNNIVDSFMVLLDKMASHEKLHEYLNSKPKVDLVIHMNLLTEAMLGIGYTVNAPTILAVLASSQYMIDYFTGCSAPYSYVPNVYLSYSDEMNFWQRVVNTVVTAGLSIVYKFHTIPYQNGVLQENFPGAPHITELIENVDLALINANFATETPKPYLPNMIRIGGFHLQDQPVLPQDLQQYMDKSKHGVVYFSFGSNVKSSSLPESFIKFVLEIFADSKYDILWKFEDELPNKPKNVRIGKWLPQTAILAHPKVVAFLSHGGFGGVNEAVMNGIPIVCMPFFGDQERTCSELVQNGFGIRLNALTVNKEQFANAFNDIITDNKYRDAVKQRSELLKDDEMNPMDRAVYWIEHVIRHKGAKHLKAKSATMPWWKYFLVDVIAFLLLVLGVAVFSIAFVCKKAFRLCFGKRNIVKEKFN